MRREAISKALEALNLELKLVVCVAEVPQLVGAAVRARSDILSAREGATDTQQLAALDLVADVFEK